MLEVTRLLSQIQSGDPSASDQLLPLVYDELRKLAAVRLRRETPDTLQATALVHEAYLRLVDVDDPVRWDGRGHFFAAAAEAMRRILVERARKKKCAKRGGDGARVALHAEQVSIPGSAVDLIELDDALHELHKIDHRKAELVKLRYFAGLTLHEAAEALEIADSTADADWAYAKAWLRVHLSG